MKLSALVAASTALSVLAGCAVTPDALPPPDYRAMLTAPCANAGDTAPWLLVDSWDDGETYRPETQFRPDGVMIYTYNGQTYDNGRWSLDGATLRFDTNNHYADYEGRFDGKSASGTMKNGPGVKGMWTLSQDCDA
jgi:hypothetical protein